MKEIKPGYNNSCPKCICKDIAWRGDGINICQDCKHEWKYIHENVDVNGRRITPNQSYAWHKIGSQVYVLNIKEYTLDKLTILGYTYENEYREGGLDSANYRLSNGESSFRVYFLKEKSKAYKDLLYQLPSKEKLLEQIGIFKRNIINLKKITSERKRLLK